MFYQKLLQCSKRLGGLLVLAALLRLDLMPSPSWRLY